ncbi:guanylate kinase [Alkalibacterium sp. MB6]|uniref:guanylate kinase n=1 Tax=Alkalibacterium sp. MB6 TaxID=2081965 RepID=UPI00137964A7|nr:AAA family ATPase [Alkalibacterium sp. MB6]
MNNKRIIVLVGPSGSGKTTIGTELSKRGIPKLVTTTTRKPRPGEKEGVDYYFRRPEDLKRDDFIEQTTYNHRIYGLTKAEVEQSLAIHDTVHVSLDKHGARAMKEAYPQETLIVFIFVSIEEMEKRMEARGDVGSKIYERLLFSKETDELRPIEEADIIIENKSIESSVEEILEEVKKWQTEPTEEV